jgi:hypothetical protein
MGHSSHGGRPGTDGASLVKAGWIVLGMGAAVAFLTLANSWLRRDHVDLGSVSSHWIAEQRMSQEQDPHR